MTTQYTRAVFTLYPHTLIDIVDMQIYNARTYKLTLYVRTYCALLITLCIVYRLLAGAHCTSRVYICDVINSQSEAGNR